MAGIEFVEVVDAGKGWTKVLASDGNVYTLRGNRNWRNNNVGNLEYGPFTKSMGAIGTDGRFAVFPTFEMGQRAREALQFESSSYLNADNAARWGHDYPKGSIGAAIYRYAPPVNSGGAFENDTEKYIQVVANAAGVSPYTLMKDLSPKQRAAFMSAQAHHEGLVAGKIEGANGVPVPPAVIQQFKGRPVPPVDIPPAKSSRANIALERYEQRNKNPPAPVTQSGNLALRREATPSYQRFSADMGIPVQPVTRSTPPMPRPRPASAPTAVAAGGLTPLAYPEPLDYRSKLAQFATEKGIALPGLAAPQPSVAVDAPRPAPGKTDRAKPATSEPPKSYRDELERILEQRGVARPTKAVLPGQTGFESFGAQQLAATRARLAEQPNSLVMGTTRRAGMADEPAGTSTLYRDARTRAAMERIANEDGNAALPAVIEMATVEKPSAATLAGQRIGAGAATDAWQPLVDSDPAPANPQVKLNKGGVPVYISSLEATARPYEPGEPTPPYTDPVPGETNADTWKHAQRRIAALIESGSVARPSPLDPKAPKPADMTPARLATIRAKAIPEPATPSPGLRAPKPPQEPTFLDDIQTGIPKLAAQVTDAQPAPSLFRTLVEPVIRKHNTNVLERLIAAADKRLGNVLQPLAGALPGVGAAVNALGVADPRSGEAIVYDTADGPRALSPTTARIVRETGNALGGTSMRWVMGT